MGALDRTGRIMFLGTGAASGAGGLQADSSTCRPSEGAEPRPFGNSSIEVASSRHKSSSTSIDRSNGREAPENRPESDLEEGTRSIIWKPNMSLVRVEVTVGAGRDNVAKQV